MFSGTPARKRKREIKRFLGIALIVVVVLGILGGGGYYLIAVKFKKPLYVSPMSTQKEDKDTADYSSVSDDPVDLLKKGLKGEKIEFSDIKSASDSSYLVTLKDGGVVTFSSEKDILTQISSLQLILSRLTMEGKLFSQLDLRFEKPVIKIRE